MLDVVTSLYDSINRNQYSGLVLVALKKAFDTVSHTTLLKKLHSYGIRGVARKLLVSYLECKKQFVALNQTRFKLMNIKYGVPQGSTLGPLFFLIYINDLNNALRSKPILFADDTCLLVTEDNSQIPRNTITDELNRLSIWCSANKLTINLSKTCVLFIPPKLTINSNFSSFFLSSNDNPINTVSSTKYLGVFIYNKLNFKEHILTLENEIARSVGILSKVRYNFPLKTLLQLYHALIDPLLTYGIVVWGSAYPSYLSKLKTKQNKAMRIISGSHYRNKANSIYKKLEVLQIHDLYTYETAKFVYSCFYNLAPIPFIDFFTKVDEVYQRATRQSVDKFGLYTPCYPTNRL